MKVFVAGGFSDTGMKEVRSVNKFLVDNNHTVIYDWTVKPILSDAQQEDRLVLAEEYIKAIKECDMIILLDHERPRAAFMEFGIGIAEEKKCWAVYDRGPSLYYSLPQCRCFETLSDLYSALSSLDHNVG
jgi:hypothetical protein